MPWDGNSEQLIFDKFLREHADGSAIHPGSTLALNEHSPSEHEGCVRVPCFWGSIFNDGEFIYRIGEYTNESDCDCWNARWPD